ncbi:iron chaperone [Mucilaginibacter sp. RCC_168]|uniref:iron chaperone n=1 Tax=Mucilaginibacter sp. RCC_168 TaxID=3239221 RepID=UPI0035253F63
MRGSDFPPPRNADEYIGQQPAAFRPALEELRHIILTTVPQATEVISYQLPCYKYHYMLVGIGTNKKYCSFYTMSPGLVKSMQENLKGVKVSGSTLHFAPDEPLPVDLIKKIITERMIQNEVLALSKKSKK